MVDKANDRPGGHRGGFAMAWLVLTVLLVLPLLALSGWWLVARDDNPTQAAGVVAPVVVPVTHEDARPQSSVKVTLVAEPGRDVVALGAGTVTDAVPVGTTLDNGVVAMRIDDRPIRAMVSAAPPWRSLAIGDTGDDVVRLRQYLAALGFHAGTTGVRFDTTLARAVVAFNVDAGLGKNVPVFDPSTVVWVGPEPVVTAEQLAGVGTSVGPGVPVASGPAHTRSVTVTEPEGGLAAVGDFGSSAVLTIGATSVPYIPGSGVINVPADVAAVSAALATATEGAAQIAAADTHRVAIVPASALVQGADGTICVYSAPDAAPVAVTPQGGGVGSTQLPDDLAVTEVISNPGRVHLSKPCNS